MHGFLTKAAACLVAAAATTQAAPITAATGSASPQLAVPKVAEGMDGMDMPLPTIAARQTILQSLLDNAHEQAASNSTAMDNIPTLAALVNAHIAYDNVCNRPPNPSDPTEETRMAKELLASVFTHYGTVSDGHDQLEKMMASDAQFAAATAYAAKGREDECDMVSKYYSEQFGKIRPETKACLCDPKANYVYCRSLLAKDMYTDDMKAMKSTISDKRIKYLAGGAAPTMVDPAKNLRVNSTWQPPSTASTNAAAGSSSLLTTTDAAAPSLLSRRAATAAFDPTSGEFTADACVPLAPEIPIEMCVKTAATAPVFASVKSTTGEYLVSEVTNGGSSSKGLFDFLAQTSRTLVEDSKIELDVSICLAIPGLTDVLNELGISLCLDLLRADVFYLQGPIAKLSTGVDLLIVNFSVWHKEKLARGAPFCPQDFDYTLMQQMCQNRQAFDALVTAFQDADFCNLDAGQGMFGATVGVDLLFWAETWDFGTTPDPREAPSCNADGVPQFPRQKFPKNKFDFDNAVQETPLDCVEAELQYLKNNPSDVLPWAKQNCGLTADSILDDATANNTCVLRNSRQHWLSYGRNEYYSNGIEARAWPGRMCYREDMFCWDAQVKFWDDYPDVAMSEDFGPDEITTDFVAVPNPAYMSTNDLPSIQRKGYYYYHGAAHNATIPRNGAWEYFQANKDAQPGLLWHGYLCNTPAFAKAKQYSYGDLNAITVDVAHARNYCDANTLSRDRFLGCWNSNTGDVNTTAALQDWQQYGIAEGRPWNLYNIA